MFRKCYLLFLLLLIPAFKGMSQDIRFKALFMYNFTKYLEWPSEKQKGDFVIGIYGTSPVKEELSIIAGKKQVGSQPIIIKEFKSPANITACHILYVPEDYSENIDELVHVCVEKGIVLITDKPGLAKMGAGLNYIIYQGKQSFEINEANLEKQGVKVDSILLSLGIVVE